MLAGRAADDPEHRRAQRDAQESRQADAATRAGHDQLPEHSGSLLGDNRLGGRSNAPLRAATMLGMQQTHGNRALQRFLKGHATEGRRDSTGGSALVHDAGERQIGAGAVRDESPTAAIAAPAGIRASPALQRQPATAEQKAGADQSGMATYLWVLDDVLDNQTSRLISDLGKYQDPFEKLYQALVGHDMTGKKIEGRQQREYFDEAALGLRVILARATDAQRAFLRRKRAALFKAEAFDRVENTAIVDGKAVEIPDDRHPHEQAAALRQVLPQLVQNVQMANEQLMRLGHKELEHALEELEHGGHGAAVAKLAALHTLLALADGWLTLNDEELQHELTHVQHWLPGVTSYAELVKAIVEIGGGAVGLTALVAATIAKATGEAALASSALSIAGEAGHLLGNVVAGIEIVHGIFVLLDPHASHEQKERGALGAASGAAWFLGKRAGGAALGAAASSAVILTYLEMKLAAYLYWQGALGISALLERESFERIETMGGGIARAAEHLSASGLLLHEEQDPNKAAALAGAEAQYRALLMTEIDSFLEQVATPTKGHGLGSSDPAGFPGNNQLIVEAFAPLQRFRGVKEGPDLPVAATAILERIGWVLAHAGAIVTAGAKHQHIQDIEQAEAAKQKEGHEE
jgi:hypothetical protein